MTLLFLRTSFLFFSSTFFTKSGGRGAWPPDLHLASVVPVIFQSRGRGRGNVMGQIGFLLFSQGKLDKGFVSLSPRTGRHHGDHYL
jgi:hypothetical protein